MNTGLRILVVEDEQHVREPLGQLLCEKGFAVDLAADGDEALDQLERNDYFLVITDISMPGMSGLELMERIGRISPDTDVMVITGNVEEDFAIQALNAGAYRYFRKPFEFLDLLAAVDSVVEKRQLEREKLFYQQLSERADAERRFAMESVQGLVAAVEAKDPYTRGHNERVGTLAEIFAAFLGLDEKETGRLARGGRLHDIGKIGTPDGILNKPARLTESEYEVIKQHPLIGEKIVTPISVLRDVAPLIRSHHEWWDGTGYPDGLAGEEILLEARVLSVVDVADALRHERAYRPGSDVPDVLDRIGSQGGTQLDPELAREFLEFVRDCPDVFP